MSTRRPSDFLLVALVGLSVATASPVFAAPGDEPAVAQYRERFKQGLDRYNEGAFTEALGYWEPIFHELGEHDGYRLAYNLGVAYMQLGDATRAADRLQAFLSEVDERRGRGDSLGAVVAKEEADARARMADLTASKGRIQVEASTPPPAVKVDAADPRLAGFVAWVVPGAHSVTFAPGTPDEETKTLTVKAGEIVVVGPTPKVPPPPAPALVPTPALAPAPAPTPALTPARSPSSPSLQLVILSGGVTVATTVAAIVLDLNASNLHDRFTAEDAATHSIPAGDRGAYDTARAEAYVVIGCAAGLAALTSGLAAWYFLGSPRHERAITPTVALTLSGAQLGVAGRF